MTKQIKISIKEYIRNYYAVPQPTYETIRKLCAKGVFKNASKEGKKWYFTIDQEELNKTEKKA